VLHNCDDWDDNGDFFKRFLCDGECSVKAMLFCTYLNHSQRYSKESGDSGKVGERSYVCGCAIIYKSAHQETADLRTKMMNSGFVGVLLAWLRAETHLVRLSAIDCVEELATHGEFLRR